MANTPIAERAAGVRCPGCKSPRSRVLDTRAIEVGGLDMYRRGRRCADCGHLFHTVEVSESELGKMGPQLAAAELRRAQAFVWRVKRALARYEQGGTDEQRPEG